MKQEITVLGCGAQQHDATITGCGGTYSKSQERLVRTVTIACLSPWIIWGVCAAVNCTYYEITTPHQVKLNHRFAELLNEPFESKKIRACIEAGADVNTNSNHGTALSIACKSQDESLVAFLLAHHADVNGPGDVLSAAIGQHDCTCNGEIKATPVRERIAVSLLSHGAKIDAKHNKGALVGAVAGNYSLKLVKDTISAGADVSESAGNIGTPVMAAITNGRIDVLELLLQHQPELDRVIWETKRPGTAVHAAVHKGNARAVRMLAAAGANVNLKDSKGRTALSYAREKQLVDVEKTLLALGAK